MPMAKFNFTFSALHDDVFANKTYVFYAMPIPAAQNTKYTLPNNQHFHPETGWIHIYNYDAKLNQYIQHNNRRTTDDKVIKRIMVIYVSIARHLELALLNSYYSWQWARWNRQNERQGKIVINSAIAFDVGKRKMRERRPLKTTNTADVDFNSNATWTNLYNNIWNRN